MEVLTAVCGPSPPVSSPTSSVWGSLLLSSFPRGLFPKEGILTGVRQELWLLRPAVSACVTYCILFIGICSALVPVAYLLTGLFVVLESSFWVPCVFLLLILSYIACKNFFYFVSCLFIELIVPFLCSLVVLGIIFLAIWVFFCSSCLRSYFMLFLCSISGLLVKATDALWFISGLEADICLLPPIYGDSFLRSIC